MTIQARSIEAKRASWLIASTMLALALSAAIACKPSQTNESRTLAGDYKGQIRVSLGEVIDEQAGRFNLVFSAPVETDELGLCFDVEATSNCKPGASGYVKADFLTERSGKALFFLPATRSVRHKMPLAIVALSTEKRVLDDVVYEFQNERETSSGGSAGGGQVSGSRPSICQSIPAWSCEEGDEACAKLVLFREDQNKGWFVDNRTQPAGASPTRDYLTSAQPNYGFSYIRRDFQMLLHYATASTICESFDDAGNLGPLGFGDLSGPSGQTPAGRHPTGSHDGGMNADIAYFQNNGRQVNSQVPVCNFNDNHCSAAPQWLDVDRTARFVAHLHEYPYVDVVAMDNQVGPIVVKAIANLCNEGKLKDSRGAMLKACRDRGVRVWWDPSAVQDKGWYRFHHHHMHVRISPQKASEPGYFVPFKTLVPDVGTQTTGFSLTSSASQPDFIPTTVPQGVGCGL